MKKPSERKVINEILKNEDEQNDDENATIKSNIEDTNMADEKNYVYETPANVTVKKDRKRPLPQIIAVEEDGKYEEYNAKSTNENKGVNFYEPKNITKTVVNEEFIQLIRKTIVYEEIVKPIRKNVASEKRVKSIQKTIISEKHVKPI
ncbi:hypothetical protein RFI_36136 [Reticulomyxa filosa]|uniref:Uncharacterized protein n=1 Tax=Reticulomyxa filosa TaxID=46433 RepID=X6LI57_RETFI|nr:hypothetical protein RFI_36136 [Reticulomyxa filosa]|eukprot:ETO01304.1 hypothetical protein RFI_36136 [Reticulomyxa filosa]